MRDVIMPPWCFLPDPWARKFLRRAWGGHVGVHALPHQFLLKGIKRRPSAWLPPLLVEPLLKLLRALRVVSGRRRGAGWMEVKSGTARLQMMRRRVLPWCSRLRSRALIRPGVEGSTPQPGPQTATSRRSWSAHGLPCAAAACRQGAEREHAEHEQRRQVPRLCSQHPAPDAGQCRYLRVHVPESYPACSCSSPCS